LVTLPCASALTGSKAMAVAARHPASRSHRFNEYIFMAPILHRSNEARSAIS
jgi:hypothetical protein